MNPKTTFILKRRRALSPQERAAEDAVMAVFRRIRETEPTHFLGVLPAEEMVRIATMIASELQRQRSRKPRRKRGPSGTTLLKNRALKCLRRYHRDITEAALIDMLEVEPLTFDDDDVELLLEDGGLVIRDLANDTRTTIKRASLRTYLCKT